MGFKKTSDLIAISFGVTESAPDTYTENEIALQLDVLNNEIFVVVAADLNCSAPPCIPGTNTNVAGAISSTSQPTIGKLSSSNVIAVAQLDVRSTTPDAVDSANTGVTAGLNGRLWGYRAKADATTYAALVQSEVLSA